MDTTNHLFIRIEGIYCEHCVETVTRTLRSLEGVETAAVRQNVAAISGKKLPAPDVIIDTIRNIGYETDESRISKNRAAVARTVKWHEFLLIAAAILAAAAGIRLLFGYNVFNAIPAVDSSLSYGMLFVTGLLTGVHCLSMCGAIGIFASSESNSVRSFRRPLLYNAGRVLSYTVIGGLVGLIGSTFSVSTTLRGVLLLAAALFMLLMALSMLGVLSFRLPRIFTFRPNGKKLGSFVIGLLNGFMPCGPLQAMQLYALSTGSLWKGGLSMALFALGTVPLMLVSGLALNLSRGKAKARIGKIAAVLMAVLAVSMLSRGLATLGFDAAKVFSPRYEGYLSAEAGDGIQTAAFELDFDSYADVVVQKGIPVRITVHAEAGRITGCNNEIVSRDFGFDVKLVPGDNVIEFTPEEEGDFLYGCWMNMITNHIKVVDDPAHFRES